MFRYGAAALLLAGAFVATVGKLQSAPRQTVSSEIQIALPLFVQVIMSMGDRNLAANLAATRALVASPEKMHPEDFRILAKVQKDVSWLNPAHEDNYYTAFAILPSYGELDAAQTILARASRVRFYDYQPAFFYAFNLFYLKHDPEGASAWLRESAEKLADDDQRLNMQNFAARWVDKSEDLDLAIRIVDSMARQAKRKDFRAYLEMRVRRLEMLRQLRTAAVVFSEQTGRMPERLAELIEAGILPVLPEDPFGFGFEFDKRGVIMLRTSPPKS
jgi:hypothetical protein